jgi:hypothetical protein
MPGLYPGDMSDCNPPKTFIVKQFASKQRCFFFGKNPNHWLPTTCFHLPGGLV